MKFIPIMKSGVSINTLSIIIRHINKVHTIKIISAQVFEIIGAFISSILAVTFDYL